mgnify:CR=1 FL=1
MKHLIIRSFVGFLACWICLLAPATAADYTLMVFGDSLSASYGIDEDAGVGLDKVIESVGIGIGEERVGRRTRAGSGRLLAVAQGITVGIIFGSCLLKKKCIKK